MKKDVIQALMDGKTIQFECNKSKGTNILYFWKDLDPIKNTALIGDLFLDKPENNWRIKPEPRTINVRMALMQNGELVYTETVNDTEEENNLEKYSNYFQYWLTDWETYNIIPNKDS